MLVGLWAGFEAGGSTNVALGKSVIFGMFFYGFGYGGFMNTFFPAVRFPLRHDLERTDEHHSTLQRYSRRISELLVWPRVMHSSISSSSCLCKVGV